MLIPDRPMTAAAGDQQEPGRRHPPLAEPGDQAAGEEARSEHGEDMPLDAQRRRRLTGWPQPIIARGAAVIMKLMRP